MAAVAAGSRTTSPISEAAVIATANPTPEARADAGPLRILLADDNVDFVTSMATLLEACGHVVGITHDGMEALEKAPGFKPELCFLDIGLPRLHGYDLARRLRALPETRDAVLVAISGWGQPEDRRRSLEAGFHHHLAKPVDFDQIESLLNEFSAARRRS